MRRHGSAPKGFGGVPEPPGKHFASYLALPVGILLIGVCVLAQPSPFSSIPTLPEAMHMRKNTKRTVLLVCFCILGLLAGFAAAGIGRNTAVPQQEPSHPTSPPANDPMPAETTAPPETETVPPSDWKLLLVNPWNQLPDDFSVELKQLKNGHAVDERTYPDLQAMLDDARAEGLSPILCSSYRTLEMQQALFTNKVNRLLAAGYSRNDAEAEAGRWVAVPGTSEHQTGLAVDIVASDYQLLDERQENTAEQIWLMENAYKYGFILRYPREKSEITGIGYEPWHYRYVGQDAAKEIYENGLCLEEYLEGFGQKAR